jgi:hypothetical protein
VLYYCLLVLQEKERSCEFNGQQFQITSSDSSVRTSQAHFQHGEASKKKKLKTFIRFGDRDLNKQASGQANSTSAASRKPPRAPLG